MGSTGFRLQLAHPAWLVALAVLPVLFHYSRRSLTRFSPRRRAAVLATRILVIVAVVLALCDVRLILPSQRLSVVFAVDESWSIAGPSHSAAAEFLNQAAAACGDGRALYLPFAAEPAAGEDRLADYGDDIQHTNLAAAIETARGLTLPGYVPRIVLLSDGNQTDGDALRAAREAGVPISTVPLEPRGAAETYATQSRPDTPRILLVEDEPDSAWRLADALRAQRIDVDVRQPDRMPSSAADLENWPLVILSNVPAAALAPRQVASLGNYVQEFGGGLLVLGGERALTPGGYRATPLEAILPVECEPARRYERPTLAMVLVVDRSLSMADGGAIELAKEAMRRAVRMLEPKDQLGILVFDEVTRWVLPLGPLTDKAAVLRKIDTVSAGGRTDICPALDKASLALDEAFTDRKHILLMTDGISHPGDFEAVAAAAARSGITLSTVALGLEPSRLLLERMARIGHGHFYACDQPASIPAVFALETAAASRLGIREKPFFARVLHQAPFLAGLELHGAPPLLGYVGTRPKPAAETFLAAETDEPLVASWRYGRGTVAVFTSDAEDRWAAGWVRWTGFGPFWSRLVRYTMRQPAEFLPQPVNRPLLRSIADCTGGTYDPDPASVFTPADHSVPRERTAWPIFLSSAAVLFLLDVALRRGWLAIRSRV